VQASSSSSSSCYQLSHSNIAIGPAPHRSGRRREHCSAVLASIAVIPGMNKIVSNRPSSHCRSLLHPRCRQRQNATPGQMRQSGTIDCAVSQRSVAVCRLVLSLGSRQAFGVCYVPCSLFAVKQTMHCWQVRAETVHLRLCLHAAMPCGMLPHTPLFNTSVLPHTRHTVPASHSLKAAMPATRHTVPLSTPQFSPHMSNFCCCCCSAGDQQH
jgi:hypothetical protein